MKLLIILSSILVLSFSSQLLSQSDTSQKPNQAIERNHLNPWEQSTGYTQTIKVGNTLYLSGLTSEADSMPAQINEIYSTIVEILNGYGLTTDHIVKETVFTLDIESLKQHASVRKKYYPNNLYPTSSWVQVDRLFNSTLLLEVEVIAHIPEN